MAGAAVLMSLPTAPLRISRSRADVEEKAAAQEKTCVEV
jgi:hypothetical protein